MKAAPAIPESVWKGVDAAIERAFSYALERRAARQLLPEHDLGGVRVCVLCGQALSTELLLGQAQKLMAPFEGVKLEGDVGDQVGDLLRRASGPFNDGLDCCYDCAYRVSQPGVSVVQ